MEILTVPCTRGSRSSLWLSWVLWVTEDRRWQEGDREAETELKMDLLFTILFEGRPGAVFKFYAKCGYE